MFTKVITKQMMLAFIAFAIIGGCNKKEDEFAGPAKVIPKAKITSPYVAADIANKEDIKLKVSSGLASSTQGKGNEKGGQGIEKSFDGDMGTLYHSSWNNSGNDYFPITLEYFFENQDRLDYIIYYPRQYSSNGIFKDVEIWTKSEGETNYTKQVDYSFENSNSPSVIFFDTPISNPIAVKFVVKKGYGDRQGFASCAEMEFYKTNSENFDYTTIFADVLCTQLKPEITEQKIKKIRDPFFKNLATYIKQGGYSTEFRVQEYKAWENPNERAKLNKNSQYSEIDGVTGIYVEKGEKLVTFVEDTHRQNIYLKFVNLDKPGGDGYSDNSNSKTLFKGMNVIEAPTAGLVYVMYNKNNPDGLAPIKIHFASGKVNGYFDSKKHQAADWERILNAATYKYFDVVGSKAHLLFETEDYKQQSPTGKQGLALIDTYDELVTKEQEMMGLIKYDRVPKNRALFHVMYHSFMYSTSYRTAYNKTTNAELLNAEKVRSNVWGVAHELGHTHQVRPNVRWTGTTEVTVNIPSLYVQTDWGNTSRLIKDNRYEKAFSTYFVEKFGHFEDPDVFCMLVPFWQLKLYFENVLGKKDFYKDLYEEARNVQAPSGDNATAEQMLNFTVIASKIAKTDLTDFFEAYGYYKKGNYPINDYSKAQADINDTNVKTAQDKAKTFGNKPEMVIRYICDNNWQYFKNKQTVQKGTASRNGLKITTQNWQNVVVFEVYDSQNNLIFVSNNASFTLKDGTATDNIKVFAIDYKGEKTPVELN